jgi:hypothetical protein
MVTDDGTTVEDVLGRLQKSIDQISPRLANRAGYATAYHHAVRDVGILIDYDRFIDPEWAERLVIGAADRFVRVLEDVGAGGPPEISAPWRLVFAAPTGLPARRKLMMGLGVQLNFDLPQAVLAVTSDDDFTHPDVLTVHQWDHERIDAIMAPRLADHLAQSDSRLVNRALVPLSRLGIRLILRDARECLWRNVGQLHSARLLGESAYRKRLAELEAITAERVQELQSSGPAVVRYTVAGFGLRLPPTEARFATIHPLRRARPALAARIGRPRTPNHRPGPSTGC